MQSNTNKQIKEMKDILLKTNERKKEILLSAGSGNIYTSGEKDISRFTETNQINTVAPIGVKLMT